MEHFEDVQEQISALVGRVMKVDSITIGTHEEKILARYRGMLRKDSQVAYDELAAGLKPHQITPMFRNEDDHHLILLLPGTYDARPSNPWVNLVLFILTLVSVMFAGAMFDYQGPIPEGDMAMITTLLRNLQAGFPFAAAMLGILLAHEFGHYLAARYHKTAVTLPYFIPLPVSLLGTMGAFIQLKEPPKNRRVLHDIGVAGPLAGLVVAIPILLVGVSLSVVDRIPDAVAAGEGFFLEGNSIFYLAVKYLIHGQLLPAPASYGGVSPLWYWVRFLFTGYPAPFGGMDVMMHPLMRAGWAGLLVTALNLLPVGQLDGGHALYVLFGRKSGRIVPFVLGGLFLLGFVWQGWWLWAALIFFLGQRHAEPLDQITPLNPGRKWIAVLVLVLFVLLFTPIPFQQYLGQLP